MSVRATALPVLMAWLMGAAAHAATDSAALVGPMFGRVANLPGHTTLLVDVRESPLTVLINRQTLIRLRHVAPASRTGKSTKDRMQLDSLLLGQKVELNACQRDGSGWLCDALVTPDSRPDLRHNVADLLVAHGLAKRTSSR